MWNINAPNLNARVDFGVLTVAVPGDFVGQFIARSPYGFLKAGHGASLGARYAVAKETLALIEGSVQAQAQVKSTVTMKSVTLDAVYGRVELFVPDPETKWERAHHDRSHH
jgi:hypothetical protein